MIFGLRGLLLSLIVCAAAAGCFMDSEVRASAQGAASARSWEKDLVGVWQDSEGMAAGWSNAFQFFADGRFRFNTNQMNCASRERAYSGTWRIINRQLVLSITERTVTVGGRLVQATGSCGSKYEIEGGRNVSRRVRPATGQSLRLVRLGLDEYGRLKIGLGGRTYWKFDSNPNAYS